MEATPGLTVTATPTGSMGRAGTLRPSTDEADLHLVPSTALAPNRRESESEVEPVKSLTAGEETIVIETPLVATAFQRSREVEIAVACKTGLSTDKAFVSVGAPDSIANSEVDRGTAV